MLNFYFDCVDKLCHRSDFELCEMDTDSLYMGISGDDLEEVIKPQYISVYKKEVYESCNPDDQSTSTKLFPRKCCAAHIAHDRRQPGLFKNEHTCDEMISLCSKSYVCRSDNDLKFSSKSIQKHWLHDVFVKFENVLENVKPEGATNIGFQQHNNTMYTYEQYRRGLSYYYVESCC